MNGLSSMIQKEDMAKKRETEKQRKKENAQIRAMGISYGKFQQLKQAGKLPENIDNLVDEKPKSKKRKKIIQSMQNDFKAKQLHHLELVECSSKMSERDKQTHILGDSAASRYMKLCQKQKEMSNTKNNNIS